MNDNGVCRTAPATPGLLTTLQKPFYGSYVKNLTGKLVFFF